MQHPAQVIQRRAAAGWWLGVEEVVLHHLDVGVAQAGGLLGVAGDQAGEVLRRHGAGEGGEGGAEAQGLVAQAAADIDEECLVWIEGWAEAGCERVDVGPGRAVARAVGDPGVEGVAAGGVGGEDVEHRGPVHVSREAERRALVVGWVAVACARQVAWEGEPGGGEEVVRVLHAGFVGGRCEENGGSGGGVGCGIAAVGVGVGNYALVGFQDTEDSG